MLPTQYAAPSTMPQPLSKKFKSNVDEGQSNPIMVPYKLIEVNHAVQDLGQIQ